MAAITPVEQTDVVKPTEQGDWHNTLIRRTSGKGTDNQVDTLTHTPNGLERLVSVEVIYDATPTYTGTGLTITRDSDLGADYDIPLNLGAEPANNARYYAWYPGDTDVNSINGEVYLIGADEVLVVALPAGGSGIGATCVITTEQLG